MTALGARLLARFAVGEATLAQLDAARDRGWITAEEYDAAVQIIDATNT